MKKLLIILALLFGGCGYKEISQYSKAVLGEKIYTNVKISVIDPENAVLIKDALNEAIISRFKSSLTNRQNASSKITISLKKVKFIPLQYNKNGYVISYRAKTMLEVELYAKKKNRKFVVSGNYDFPIEPNSVISDSKRFEAIKESSKKALDSFISKVAAIGYERVF